MHQLIFQISYSDLKQYFKKYQNFLIENNNSYISYRLKILDHTISFYKSLKVLIQGKEPQKILETYFKNNLNNNMITITKNHDSSLKLSDKDINFQNTIAIGSDEVGVGDYFGGLVVCAAMVDHKTLKVLQNLNIQDSKKLTDKYMMTIYPKLINSVEYVVFSFDVKTYNSFIAKYKNIHLAKTYLHYKAIKTLLDKYKNTKSFTIIDEFVNQKKWNEYLKILNLEPIKIDCFQTKAESAFLAVASASIIARINFLKQIDTLSKSINLSIPLGAWNNNVKKIATEIYRMGGLKLLEQYVKIHFKNTEKIIK